MPSIQFDAEHVGLPARDPAKLKDWYVRVLGAMVAFADGRTPPAFLLRLGRGALIEIYSAVSSVPQTGDNTLAGWRHLAVRVKSIEAARDHLLSEGVAFTDPIKPAGGGGRVLFFRDPEGNLLHLVERPEGSNL
jgi:glyoxylase I family protein